MLEGREYAVLNWLFKHKKLIHSTASVLYESYQIHLLHKSICLDFHCIGSMKIQKLQNQLFHNIKLVVFIQNNTFVGRKVTKKKETNEQRPPRNLC